MTDHLYVENDYSLLQKLISLVTIKKLHSNETTSDKQFNHAGQSVS
jgi:hypothetical protein